MVTPEPNRTDHTTPRAAGHAGERGMALVLALLVLFVLTVLGAALMANVSTETKITGHKVRDTQALTLAEAGVQEAMLRLRKGDVLDDGNPRAVTLIYNQAAGSLPVSGADTTSLATLQTAGNYLAYSTGNKTPAVLSIRYKTRGGQVLKYDDTATPKINTATGSPIWIVTSTGRKGTASRQVYAEVTRTRFNMFTRAAIASRVSMNFKGNFGVCGHDHRADTPAQTGPPACDGLPNWWSPTVHGTCLPGGWSTGSIDQSGSAAVVGEPDNWQDGQPGFYSGPWDALGLQQSEFWPWVGIPVVSAPATPQGIYYLDNDNVKQNKSGTWSYNGGSGEGLLYCDGDLQLNGNFNFRGLLYVEGDVAVNGNTWILGGLIVNGKSTVIKITNGSAIILYSAEAIQQTISKHGGDLRTIAWREL